MVARELANFSEYFGMFIKLKSGIIGNALLAERSQLAALLQ